MKRKKQRFNLFLWRESKIFSIITPVFSIKKAFWNHSNMLICCSRNVLLFFSMLKTVVLLTFFSDLYINYMDKSTGTPPSLEEKRNFHTVATKIETLQKFWSVWNDCTHMYKALVFGDEFLAQGLHLKSHQRCSAGIRTCLSADQSSSSTLTESSFLFDTCLIHRDTVVLE